jgi:hypothetical protein
LADERGVKKDIRSESFRAAARKEHMKKARRRPLQAAFNRKSTPHRQAEAVLAADAMPELAGVA